MKKNEFMMVPRELDVEGARDFYNEHWTGRCEDLWPQLLDYVKAKPAEQHQGEPVAWMAWIKLGSLAGQLIQVEHATNLNPKLYEGPFPVFRHADPGEIERLRAEAGQHKLAMDAACGEIEALRAQLAERDALLREAYNELAKNAVQDIPEVLMDKIDATLPASAKPSAPKCRTCNGTGLEYDSGAAHPCTDCKP
jgi:hypothetical protein